MLVTRECTSKFPSCALQFILLQQLNIGTSEPGGRAHWKHLYVIRLVWACTLVQKTFFAETKSKVVTKRFSRFGPCFSHRPSASHWPGQQWCTTTSNGIKVDLPFVIHCFCLFISLSFPHAYAAWHYFSGKYRICVKTCVFKRQQIFRSACFLLFPMFKIHMWNSLLVSHHSL